MFNKLDNIDIIILNLLQENSRIAIKKISQKVFLSPPATADRLEKLEHEGYIKKHMAVLDYTKVGYPIKALIHVKANRTNRNNIMSRLEKCPNVIECDFVAGDYCMVISAMFSSTRELGGFIDELQRNNADTQTQIILSTPIERRGIALDTKNG